MARECSFRVTELEPRLPSFEAPGGRSSPEFLRALVDRGAQERYGDELGPEHRRQIEHELYVIGRLELADYFLIVWDIVRFANRRGILVQGRGSAANSAVCYCLGITAVDPVGMDLLFERFLSEERGEAPDIDLDIAHDDREEVLQYVYRRYGRDHAAMVCETITYRGRMAVRDAARVLGFRQETIDELAAQVDRSEAGEAAERLAEGGAARAGLDPGAARTRALVHVVRGLDRLPRHRSIHVGGFVLGSRPVGETVPVEEASMEGRTIIQWDKDDLSLVGMIKIDLLGLGMLTVLGETLAHLRRTRGVAMDLAGIPQGDEATYDMICEADTVGVFQIESRAQMNTLPRVQPRSFYDLAIEVALIRPGPIQGEMVHPYLRRRRGEEPVTYLDEWLKPVLERTLGVPLFQEQGMRVAIELAGFTPTQADRLRRAMGFKRSEREMSRVGKELAEGLEENGVPPEVREKVFEQLTAFSNYGFPESHALSFALLVYASSYLKRHYAPEFFCATLNAQPMGFYAPSTLIEDAKRHGVEVRPVDLARSAWDCTLEPGSGDGGGREDGRESHGDPAPPDERLSRSEEGETEPRAAPALRLGLRLVRGLGSRAEEKLKRAREDGPFTSVEDVVRRSGLGEPELRTLAEAGAFGSLWPGRREALWELLRELRGDAGPLAPRPRSGEGEDRQDARDPGRATLPERGRDRERPPDEARSGRGDPEGRRSHSAGLPPLSRAERVRADYRTLGLSTEGHPMEFLRDRLRRDGVLSAEELARQPAGAEVAVAGIAIVRQRPKTARGVMFVTLEDETGFANFVVTPDLLEERHAVLARAPVLRLEGVVEREGEVVNVQTERAFAVDPSAGAGEVRSRDFR
ncbi:MAG: DNA polymerase III subunit alpha, partial [Gemmatimonadota bacterium]